MTQKRAFRRITSAIGGTVECRDSSFACRLENLSLGGALVTLREAVTTGIRTGDRCRLLLALEAGERQFAIEARVAHHVFAFVGVAFLNLDTETQAALKAIIEREERAALKMNNRADYGSAHVLQ